MKTIWKFPIETTDQQNVEMPTGAQVLCVQLQSGILCLWAVVDPNRSKETRVVRIFGTGHPVDGINQSQYVGTYQLGSGTLVFHVFITLPGIG